MERKLHCLLGKTQKCQASFARHGHHHRRRQVRLDSDSCPTSMSTGLSSLDLTPLSLLIRLVGQQHSLPASQSSKRSPRVLRATGSGRPPEGAAVVSLEGPCSGRCPGEVYLFGWLFPGSLGRTEGLGPRGSVVVDPGLWWLCPH